VNILAPLSKVLAKGAFVGHTELRHHPSRSFVARKVMGHHAVQIALCKGIIDHKPARLRHVAVVPVWHADPVAKFSMIASDVDSQSNCANECTVLTANDRPHRSSTFGKAVLLRCNPPLGLATWIRMRDQ